MTHRLEHDIFYNEVSMDVGAIVMKGWVNIA